MPPPTASFSKNGKRRNRTASGSGIWRDVVCVELNALLLVRLSRVNVDDRDVAVEEFLEHFDMHGRIGADRPVARNLFQQKSLCRAWRRRPPPPITRRRNFPGPQRARRSLRKSSRRLESRLFTVEVCQAPPRAVRTPRALSASAMPARLVMLDAWMVRTIEGLDKALRLGV